MSNKIIDLDKSRQEKRLVKGWSLDEIKKNAEKELRSFKKGSLPEEPKDLASGDMKKIIEGDDDQ